MLNKNQVKKLNIGIFSLVALLHLWRAVSSKILLVGEMSLPVWISYLVFVILAGLVYLNYKAE